MPHSSRPAEPPADPPVEPPTIGFGPTVFDGPEPAFAQRSVAALPFDVCHVGVVLRALLLVHGVVGVGALFTTSGRGPWMVAAGTGSANALPAVLLWLLAACALRRSLAAMPLAGQWAVALGLGAASGAAGSALASLISLDPVDSAAWAAPALAGAGLAAVMLQWLQLRAAASLPADTTARLAELQARIQPHFLFNTLNTALALVRLDPPRAEAVLEDLAELFRVAIGERPEAVSLASEIDLAQRYLAIEQIRFGDRLILKWDLAPEAGAAMLPPLLLQPLVENAVRHGIEPAAEGGTIRIATRVRLGRAIVSIINSVPPEPSRPGHGMALRNVRERLRLMHDVAATFDTRREGNVFRVQLAVPL